ncbi:hypothetical protein K474DRAFT_1640546 [Panus rudis PR-1116 ss-1]|nr:hypothetical protein K474DRAFT_1640546 [Panus rudis PR-1116 ss-1]
MPPPATKPPAPRKRQRKRKRRVASSSESSSSSDSDSDSSASSAGHVKITKAKERSAKAAAAAKAKQIAQEKESDTESPSSSESSSSESDDGIRGRGQTKAGDAFQEKNQVAQSTKPSRRRSTSPDKPPQPVPLPSFIPNSGDAQEDAKKEQELKDRFRKFWMESIADAFKGDLEVIQQEPNMNPSRLAVLIDSLASGADVFSSSASTSTGQVNEMEIILDSIEETGTAGQDVEMHDA